MRDLDRAIVAAKQAVQLATERYERGLTDFLNVLDAQRQLFALQAQYVEVQQDAAEQLVRLYKALGGGWETYQAVPSIRQPQPAIAAAVSRALAPKNVHEYLQTQQPARSEVIVAREPVLADEIGADHFPRKIQAKSKSSQIEPNPAKPGQIQPREKLGFPWPNRALSKTCADPLWRFFFLLLHSRPLRPNPPETPHGRRSGLAQNPPAPIESPIRPGNCLVDHACLVRRRKIGVSSSKEQYGTVSKNLQGKVEKAAERPGIPGHWRRDRRSRLPRSATAATDRGYRAPHAFSRSNLAGAGAAARNSKRAPGRLSSTVSLKPCRFAIVSAMLRPRPCPGDLPLPSPR